MSAANQRRVYRNRRIGAWALTAAGVVIGLVGLNSIDNAREIKRSLSDDAMRAITLRTALGLEEGTYDLSHLATTFSDPSTREYALLTSQEPIRKEMQASDHATTQGYNGTVMGLIGATAVATGLYCVNRSIRRSEFQ